MASITDVAEDASDAMAFQTIVLGIIGIGVITAIGIGVNLMLAFHEHMRKLP